MKARIICGAMAFLLTLSSGVISAPPKNRSVIPASADKVIDLGTWIDANKLLMFVTNRGSFGYDQGGMLGKNDGLYYPFISLADITSGTNNNSVLFASGVWIGGTDNSTGQKFVSVSEYSDDFYPGKMIGGTFDPAGETDPKYRVYKLYADSMAGNPNQDYIEWPTDQGAPVTPTGEPELEGLQTLWTVYNDANPAGHTNDASSATGLGIEIQQTVWAEDDEGPIDIWVSEFIPVSQNSGSGVHVAVKAVDPAAMNGHDYRVVTDSVVGFGYVWHLFDLTAGFPVLVNQSLTVPNTTVTSGFLVNVSSSQGVIESFEAVANGAGTINPPGAAAFDFQGFPTPLDSSGVSTRPDNFQQVGEGRWAIHTGDNGGSCNSGTRGSYDAFVSRSLRGNNANAMGFNDYEMRFTGDTNNFGDYDQSLGGGSWGIEAFEASGQENPIWVPFELWRTGIGTPSDLSDDVRLVPWVLETVDDNTYNLTNWGCSANPTHGGDGEHSASGADNDPFTDWVYWYLDDDETPGQSGYLDAEAQILAWTPGNTVYDFAGTEILARTVLINWNGDTSAASTGIFNQKLPEPGTVFRIRTANSVPIDTATFTANPPPVITSGPKGLTIYKEYKLYNKGGKNLRDCYFSIWSDPDLGNAGDDFVGCDSADDLFYCYNDGADADYGTAPPAVGFKFLYGPLVPSVSDTAYFAGNGVAGFKNLGMTAFSKYINGVDPQNPTHTYNFMQGFDRDGNPLIYNGSPTKYYGFGDPVTGTGFLDVNSSDRRMMGTCGPFNMAPGDSQYVLLRIAVGQGLDQLSSITSLRSILNQPKPRPQICCVNRGDMDRSGGNIPVDIGDLTYFVDFMFRGGPPAVCAEESDANADGGTDIADMTFIVDFIFRNGQPPPGC